MESILDIYERKIENNLELSEILSIFAKIKMYTL